MRNADRIRAMSDDELRSFIWNWQANALAVFIFSSGSRWLLGTGPIKEWLKSEVFKCEMTMTPEDEE